MMCQAADIGLTTRDSAFDRPSGRVTKGETQSRAFISGGNRGYFAAGFGRRSAGIRQRLAARIFEIRGG